MAQDSGYKKRLELVEREIFNSNSVLSVDGLLVSKLKPVWTNHYYPSLIDGEHLILATH